MLQAAHETDENNGIMEARSKVEGRFVAESTILEQDQAAFEHTELRFECVH